MAPHAPGSTAAPPPRWSLVLRVAVARAFLTMLCSLLLWALAPVLLGWQPHLIMTGSMMPRIAPGDVIVTRAVDPATLREGQVVTVTDPDHDGRTRTHRIARIAEDGRLVLRGDANEADDSSPVAVDAVLGVGVLRVPYVGRPLLWWSSGNRLALGLALALMAWATVTAARGLPRPTARPEDRDHHDRGPDDGPDDGPGDEGPGDDGMTPTAPGRQVPAPRGRRVLVGLAGMVTASLVAGGAPALAAYHQPSSNPTSSFATAASYLSYLATVQGDAPALYWRLEEKSGTSVADSSGNGGTATLHGSPTMGVTGALGSDPSSTAFRLSGQRFTQNTLGTAPSVFSIEAWIRTTSTTGGRVLGFGNRNGSQNSTSTDRILYVGNDGRAYFGVGSLKRVAASASALNDGAWHHVVATYSGTGTNGMKLYVDGALVAQNTASPVSLSGYWRAGGDTMSGWTANPTTSWYTGDLDEVAIYPTALSAAQVSAHWAAG